MGGGAGGFRMAGEARPLWGLSVVTVRKVFHVLHLSSHISCGGQSGWKGGQILPLQLRLQSLT